MLPLFPILPPLLRFSLSEAYTVLRRVRPARPLSSTLELEHLRTLLFLT